MNWWQGLLLTLMGLVCGMLLTAFFGPLRRRIERAGRVAWDEPPVDVHVEADQAIIWAGMPQWIIFSHYFTGGLPIEPPPVERQESGAWASRHGGVDLGLTMLQLTVTTRADVTVVIQTPLITSSSTPLPPGVGAIISTGGADINPRRYDIALGMGSPLVTFNDPEVRHGHRAPAPSWKLAAGDVEQLHLWVTADDDQMHEWSLQIPLLIDGRRVLHDVNGGIPFVTAGRTGVAEQRLWDGHEWVSPC